MAKEEINLPEEARSVDRLPEFETYEDLMDRFAEADARHTEVDFKADEAARRLLGNVTAPVTARGRVQMVSEALRAAPDAGVYTDLPLAALRAGRENRPLDGDARLFAMAVNEKVLEQLYEEAGVDYRLRGLYERRLHGHTVREITYPTDKGYAFIEEWQYGYKEDPNTALPTDLDVFVGAVQDGKLVGERYLAPPAPEEQRAQRAKQARIKKLFRNLF